MASIVTPENVAFAVLNHWLGGQVDITITTEELHAKCFAQFASLGTVRKAVNEAANECLIQDVSHHAGRRVWRPSLNMLRKHIIELRRHQEDLRKTNHALQMRTDARPAASATWGATQ